MLRHSTPTTPSSPPSLAYIPSDPSLLLSSNDLFSSIPPSNVLPSFLIKYSFHLPRSKEANFSPHTSAPLAHTLTRLHRQEHFLPTSRGNWAFSLSTLLFICALFPKPVLCLLLSYSLDFIHFLSTSDWSIVCNEGVQRRPRAKSRFVGLDLLEQQQLVRLGPNCRPLCTLRPSKCSPDLAGIGPISL
ncbi:unnamed protein product [Protopolystoma xenopodis]|uniref:Uncharacterized protein n=1 Tax=Protopolystoma xenopodis TaxID=117903 RepID=A0A3S5CUC0_9PLAT|nr:unnamed protein product [Protopolystoma xenopodis]